MRSGGGKFAQEAGNFRGWERLKMGRGTVVESVDWGTEVQHVYNLVCKTNDAE